MRFSLLNLEMGFTFDGMNLIHIIYLMLPRCLVKCI